MSEDGNVSAITVKAVTAILRALEDVRAGQNASLSEADLPEGHVLRALYAGVNRTIAVLATERAGAASYRAELEEKLEMIEAQRTAIRELSTPIIEVWRGVLCLPIVGIFDSTRSAEMTETLLTAIVTKRARCAIIDVTGIQVMDTATADHFLRMAHSVKLLGARCMLTGVHPNIAQTIVHMGVQLDDLETHRTLRVALTRYLASVR